jgi:hypothetical protein
MAKDRKSSPRPKLVKVSEEMKAWSAALGAELTTWPAVSSRPMFGFQAYYHGDQIFALLPRSRGMETANSVAFRLSAPRPTVLAEAQGDTRIRKTGFAKGNWFNFEISSDDDLKDTLRWLLRAYRAAG